MNAPLSAYTQNQRNTETGRTAEARALLSCAARLEAARDPSTASADVFWDAVKHNQKLWTFFQASLCDPSNLLSREVKTLLLNISIYVDKTSFQALAENNRNLLPGLININRTLAKGLSVDNDAPQQQTASAEKEPTSVSTSA